MKRLLVTTALEESWRDDVPLLLLGEWCRRHSRKESWSRLDAELLPYHWDDRDKLHADYAWLQALYVRLLPELARQLNAEHGVEHDERYWRILAGPWLGYFLQILFDRWSCIERALAQYDVSGSIVLQGSGAVPNDMADFVQLYVRDDWNHHLYAQILEQFGVPATMVEAPAHSPAAAPPGWKRRLRVALAAWAQRGASLFAREDDVFLLSTYLSRAAQARLSLRLRQAPQFWRSVPASQVAADPQRRQWSLDAESFSGFEQCARRLIARQIPTAYLEGYRLLCERGAKLRWPARPKFIWTSNSHSADDVFKAWAAGKVEQGARLVIGQHGGHYGTGRWSFLEEHELAICDRYLSWGWSEEGQGKIAPVGMFKPATPLGVQHAQQAGALLVTTTVPRYSYWMYSIMVARQWLDYFDDQCSFVRALPPHIADALTVRLYSKDYGWDQQARWRERLPAVALDDGSGPLNALVARSRLYISTYNATTFLESISMGVPTVMFWNPAQWELRDSAQPSFERLRQVGIFHTSPESAAAFVAGVWDDVDGWWSSPPVRAAVAAFAASYCDLAGNPLEKIAAVLRALPTSTIV